MIEKPKQFLHFMLVFSRIQKWICVFNYDFLIKDMMDCKNFAALICRLAIDFRTGNI